MAYIHIDPKKLGLAAEQLKPIQKFVTQVNKTYAPVEKFYAPVLNKKVEKLLTSVKIVDITAKQRIGEIISSASVTHQMQEFERVLGSLKVPSILAKTNTQVLSIVKSYDLLQNAYIKKLEEMKAVTNTVAQNFQWASEISLHIPPDYLMIVQPELKKDYENSPLCLQETEEGFENELDELLTNLNSEFPSIRRGAWQTFYSASEDRWRQSSTSMRELLNQVLQTLSPDQENRKKKVKAIFVDTELESDSLTDLAVKCANVVDALHSSQSKLTHTNFRNDKAARFILVVTEELLYLFLKNKIC